MKQWLLCFCLLAAAVTLWAGEDNSESAASPASTAAVTAPSPGRNDRLEGEKRYQTNCGRCHQRPRKYPPRMMSTMIRHMRVRATITDDDMRYILAYMTE